MIQIEKVRDKLKPLLHDLSNAAQIAYTDKPTPAQRLLINYAYRLIEMALAMLRDAELLDEFADSACKHDFQTLKGPFKQCRVCKTIRSKSE